MILSSPHSTYELLRVLRILQKTAQGYLLTLQIQIIISYNWKQLHVHVYSILNVDFCFPTLHISVIVLLFLGTVLLLIYIQSAQ